MIPVVDAGPLSEIIGQQPDENQKVDVSDNSLPALDEVAISLDLLKNFDADVELKVDQVIHLPGDIRDASLKVGRKGFRQYAQRWR